MWTLLGTAYVRSSSGGQSTWCPTEANSCDSKPTMGILDALATRFHVQSRARDVRVGQKSPLLPQKELNQ